MQNNVEYLFRQNVHSSMGSQHPPSATLTLNKIGFSKNKYLHSLFDPRDINHEIIRTDIVTAFNAFAKKFLDSKSYSFSPKLVFLPVPPDIISRLAGAL